MHVGAKFGRLRFAGLTGERTRDGHLIGRFGCDCGQTADVATSRVRSGTTRSCGCLARETAAGVHTTHGGRSSPEYGCWQAMVSRCCNPESKDFPRYGGAGITLCPEWRSFAAFLAHIGRRPPNTSIDRINGNRGYEPGNVRWATPRQQAHNRKDLTIVTTPLGAMALADYAKRIGLTKGAAHLRLKRGKLEGVAIV